MDETPWLRDILRFALTATSSTDPPWLATSDMRATGDKPVDPDDPGKDPRFRKLVEAILFGRKFLKTYNLVLLGILVVFSIWHWGDKLVLHRRKRRITQEARPDGVEEEAEAWSSSSSTIEGNTTPPVAPKQKAVHTDEASPLLSTTSATRPNRRSLIWYPYYLFQSILQYQPPPIPVVNKTLPTNAVSLLVILWLALIVFYNFYAMPISFPYIFVFADRCGIIFISNLPLLYLLGAKNQPLKMLTGYSYESLNIFHRRVGEVMCLEAFLHFAGMWAVWYAMLRHLGLTLAKFVFNRVVLLGLAAFLAYELIYFTSLGSFRQRWYEVFLGLHIVLQVLGLVFLWFHHSSSRPYVGIAMAIWVVDRAVYRMWAKRSTHPADLSIMDDGETVLLSANWEVEARSSIFKPKNMKNGWEPNQHVFISIPALGKKYALQSHPFTIFSAAPTSQTLDGSNTTANHGWFTLLVRAQSQSGFAHKLLTHASTHPTATIHLDGPYGSPHAISILQSSQTAILIAGGSGIAVAYPLLYALLHPATCPSDPESTPSPTQTRSMRDVKLLWITHSPEHRLWVPEEKMHELERWGLDVLMPPPTSMAGRPDVRAILEAWVGDKGGGRSGVVVSGPEALVRDVRNGCAGLMRRGGGRDVGVVVEKFGW